MYDHYLTAILTCGHLSPLQTTRTRQPVKMRFDQIDNITEKQSVFIDSTIARNQHDQCQLASLQKYAFQSLIIRHLPLSNGDQGSMFDAIQNNRKNKTWLYSGYLYKHSELYPTFVSNKYAMTYLRPVILDETVHEHMRTICEIFKLQHVHHTVVISTILAY